MRLATPLTAIGLAAALAACGRQPEETAAPAAPAAPAAEAPAPAAPAAQAAKGTGTVTAVAADSITIDHGPIPEANWPAMVMSFQAPPELAQSVKPGDKVAFDLRLEGGGGQITAIQKQ